MIVEKEIQTFEPVPVCSMSLNTKSVFTNENIHFRYDNRPNIIDFCVHNRRRTCTYD